MPKEDLCPQGLAAYGLWRTLHEHDRPYWPSDGSPLALPLGAVRGIIADYGLSLEMQELVLALESAVLPMLRKEHAARMKKK